MTALICKYCGAYLHLAGKTHGFCDSCGSEVTLPNTMEEKRISMFNRGNHFRTAGIFDEAYSAYEHIIAQDPTDAEAHWCLALCRYGVEYVKDERAGDYKPTISRLNSDSILDDPDYLDALRYSDGSTAGVYRTEALKIDRIQRRLLEIVRRESPVDVFICFKDTDENRKRTRSSIVAQEIYERLTDEGLNVFFSRITLEDKLGEEYEPYIFAALNSARLMLVVADHPDQLHARWVRNEWSRFLSMQDLDSGKAILPVFWDMPPSALPEELKKLQGQDMRQLGSMENLVENVLRLTRKPRQQTAPADAVRFRLEALLNQARHAQQANQSAEARALTMAALELDPGCTDAHLLLFFLQTGIPYLEAMMDHLDGEMVVNSQHFQNAKVHSTGTVKQRLEMLEAEYRVLWQQRQIEKQIQAAREKQLQEQARAEEARRRQLEEDARENRRKELLPYQGTAALRAQMRSAHPQEYARYTQLYRAVKNNTKSADGQSILYVPAAVAAMVLLLVGALLMVHPRITGAFILPLNAWASGAIISVSVIELLLLMDGENWSIRDLPYRLILAAVPCVILAILNTAFGVGFGYVVLVLAVLIELFVLSELRSNKEWRRCYRLYAAYRDETIIPLSKQLREAAARKFAGRRDLRRAPWQEWALDLDLKAAKDCELEPSDPNKQ